MRQRSLSITPTFSTDRALLLSSYPHSPRVVKTLEDVRRVVSSWGIGTDSTFLRRTNLETDADWLEFIRPCLQQQSANDLFLVDLDLLLKRCYSVAYGVTSSPPLAAIKRQHSLTPDKSFEEEPTPLAI
jgi:hypothetical protein